MMTTMTKKDREEALEDPGRKLQAERSGHGVEQGQDEYSASHEHRLRAPDPDDRDVHERRDDQDVDDVAGSGRTDGRAFSSRQLRAFRHREPRPEAPSAGISL